MEIKTMSEKIFISQLVINLMLSHFCMNLKFLA